jgi:hypothetical protein
MEEDSPRDGLRGEYGSSSWPGARKEGLGNARRKLSRKCRAFSAHLNHSELFGKEMVLEPPLHEAAAEIGHWVFRLERDPASHAELWEFRCKLCDYKLRYKLGKGVDYVLPLTGNLSKRRRDHDRSKHSETVREQARAERAAIGSNPPRRPLL